MREGRLDDDGSEDRRTERSDVDTLSRALMQAGDLIESALAVKPAATQGDLEL
jgi:hypothetical protein